MLDHDDTLVEIEGNEDEATPLLLNSTNERHRPYSTVREQQEQGNQRWQTSPAAPPVCVPNFIVIG